ncbi:MAG: hypothetical protein IPH24_17670 [Crocinitomicaceae bacterium]|nr:hypothetical protein [Crocinitomicaceae bacterium]
MDLVLWFKKCADQNPNYSANINHWKDETESVTIGQWIGGKIIKLAENGYGTFQPNAGGSSISIIPSMVSNFNLKLGQAIEVRTKLDSTGTKTLITEIRLT